MHFLFRNCVFKEGKQNRRLRQPLNQLQNQT